MGALTTFNCLSFLALSSLHIAGYEFSNFELSFFAVTLGVGLVLSFVGVIMSSLASVWRQDRIFWFLVALFGALPFASTAVYNLLAYP